MFIQLRAIIIFVGLLILAQTSGGFLRGSQQMIEAVDSNQMADVTKGLTDSDVGSALEDLSVQDLRALSEFMDNAKTIDYDYVEDNFLDNNIRMGPLYEDNLKSDTNGQDANDMIYEDMNSDEVLTDLDAESVVPYRAPRKVEMYGEEIPRAKRESTESAQMISVDEEYLKQLENSFPRDQGQADQEEHGEQKEHIRVKRF